MTLLIFSKKSENKQICILQFFFFFCQYLSMSGFEIWGDLKDEKTKQSNVFAYGSDFDGAGILSIGLEQKKEIVVGKILHVLVNWRLNFQVQPQIVSLPIVCHWRSICSLCFRTKSKSMAYVGFCWSGKLFVRSWYIYFLFQFFRKKKHSFI